MKPLARPCTGRAAWFSLFGLVLLAAPLHAQDTRTSTELLNVVPYRQNPSAEPDRAASHFACPSDVPLGTQAVRFNGEVTTTNPDGVTYRVEIRFTGDPPTAGKGREDGKLAVVERTTTPNGAWSFPAAEGGTLAQLDATVTPGQPLQWALSLEAAEAGTVSYTFQTFLNGALQRNEACTFDILEAPAGADLALRIEEIRGALAFDPVAGTATLPLGTLVDLCIQVTNNGPDAASQVVVTGGADPLFLGIVQATVGMGGGTCDVNAAEGFFSCPNLLILTGTSATVEVTLDVLALIDETAFSASTGHPNDPDFSNNDALLAITVAPATQTGSATGTAFLDANGDGMQQTDEPGLSDRLIFNDLNSNATYDPGVDPSVPTDASGHFIFSDLQLPALLGQVLPEGWESTFPVDGFYAITEDGTEFFFGSRPIGGAILGKVFLDNNGDGRQSELEHGQEGVIVELHDRQGTVVATTTTMTIDLDGDGLIDPSTEIGLYQFTSLEAGGYRVRIQVPDGFLLTLAPPFITLAEGELKADQDFGLFSEDFRTYSVRGRKYADENGNGMRDEGEPFLNGRRIKLDRLDFPRIAMGYPVATAVREMVTAEIDGEPGSFRFEGLDREMTYAVSEDRSADGFRQTEPFNELSTSNSEFDFSYVLRGLSPGSLDFGNQLVEKVTVDDEGDGEKLREIIEACNARDEDEPPCDIDFLVLQSHGKQALTIRPTRPLPALTRPLVLDGGGNVILDGSTAGPAANGLHVTAGGTDISGLTITGFSGHGILLEGEGRNRIRDNVVSGQGGDGVRVASGAPHLFFGNTIHGNGGLAIDVGGDGPTPNDPDERDGVQNYPVLSAVSTVADTTVVEGTLASTPEASFTLAFFASRTCRNAGQGEGESFLGATIVVTDSQGHAAFTVRDDTLLTEQHFITATATNTDGATSEFSPCDASLTTGAETSSPPEQPRALQLHRNYPNPFHPSTTLVFDLPAPAEVRVEIFDLLGRKQWTLAPRFVTAGAGRTLRLDASALASGLYVYRVVAVAAQQTHAAWGRFVVLR